MTSSTSQTLNNVDDDIADVQLPDFSVSYCRVFSVQRFFSFLYFSRCLLSESAICWSRRAWHQCFPIMSL